MSRIIRLPHKFNDQDSCLLLSGLSHAVTKLQDHIQNGLSKEQKYSNAKSEVIAAEQSIEIAKFM
ncbi:hypothetical protein L8P05_22930 [Enterobacter cloacae]|uniref:hypothetical protein n=1 Tax=Enterobacter cloacae TaxID=550 RepID=UPI002003B441|nr:hypothetical protein [Enterobacter cloacae]MCK7176774.1 hypothetical protein [Enterobacter cloacae]